MIAKLNCLFYSLSETSHKKNQPRIKVSILSINNNYTSLAFNLLGVGNYVHTNTHLWKKCASADKEDY